MQGTLTSRAPRYSIILELDRKVRDMELPVYAHGPAPQGVGLAQTMSHFMPTNYRELSELFHLLLCLLEFFVLRLFTLSSFVLFWNLIPLIPSPCFPMVLTVTWL